MSRRKSAAKRATAFFAVFGIGGLGYNFLEVAWRGHSHWSMTVAGGLCLCILYRIHNRLPHGRVFEKCILSALCITGVELAVGCIVNLWLGLRVWDYTNQPYNLWGQICLAYSCLWFLMGVPCDLLCEKIKKILG